MTCPQPDCSGVVEDGYCTTCGMAETSGAARSDRARAGGTLALPTARAAMSSLSNLRPALAPHDPTAALIPPVVPEHRRRCPACEAQLERESGSCPHCGQEFAFTPTLKPGDRVAGKYEVQGTLAFGGMGWIYLAKDAVLGRWVVLKGLLNSKDPGLIAQATQEREYLAAVKHPNIVGIHDFAIHDREGFIVMEYVSGTTLLGLRKQRGGPMPPREAISYLLQILPAFQYLEQRGLVYCDFKPENAMVEGASVKLIDLGAVRRIDDRAGDVYGSRGYAAPEAAEQPTHRSDLYSVARTLAVLVADFDFQGRYEQELPPPAELALFAEHDSLHRFLRTATRRDPKARFGSAEEMGAQLLGVLRDVVADPATLSSPPSSHFEPFAGHEELGAGPSSQLHRLPRRKGESLDPPADDGPAPVDPAPEGDWRLGWRRGRECVAQREFPAAVAHFERVLDDLPGELAPRQALAQALELEGDSESALVHYALISQVDPTCVGATFGLARCLLQQGNRAAAADAFRRVPATSNLYAHAQVELARTLLLAQPEVDDLRHAAHAIANAQASRETVEVHQLAADLYRCAVERLGGGLAPPKAGELLLDAPWNARALRRAAERELRRCAELSTEVADRIRFVDAANRARPWTLV
jgi:serine/threonine-protein kinase PknG